MSALANLERARRIRSERKRRVVEEAIHDIAREGHPITILAVAKRAAVSRTYLYANFKAELLRERRASETNRCDGKVVPLRTMDSYRHIEAALRHKIERLELEIGQLRAAARATQLELERERGKVEHWRQQYELALTNPKACK